MESCLRRVLRSEEVVAPAPCEPGIHRVRVGGADVLVARLSSGEVVAFGTTCPHQETPLDDAIFWDGKLRCGRHLYLYDPQTGENVLPARTTRPDSLWKLKPGYLRTHRVEERDGWIWVDERPNPPPPGYDPARERRPPALRRAPRPPPPVAPVPAGPLEHPVEAVVARCGQQFSLVLPTAPRPGHIWRVEGHGDLLAVVSQRFQGGERPGFDVRLVARAEGEATVRCTYATPWDPVPKEVRTFAVRIEPASA